MVSWRVWSSLKCEGAGDLIFICGGPGPRSVHAAGPGTGKRKLGAKYSGPSLSKGPIRANKGDKNYSFISLYFSNPGRVIFLSIQGILASPQPGFISFYRNLNLLRFVIKKWNNHFAESSKVSTQ